MLVPTIRSMSIPASSSIRITPMCAYPRGPPLLSTSAMRGEGSKGVRAVWARGLSGPV